MPLKLLVICGSPRSYGTKILTDIAYQHAKTRGVNVEYIEDPLIDQFRGYDEEYSERTNQTIRLIRESDAYIIGTPVYNNMISSALKNLFEFIEHHEIEGRVAGFIIKGGGSRSLIHVHNQLTGLMNYFRVICNPKAVYATDQDLGEDNRPNENLASRIRELVDETIALAEHLNQK